MDTKTAHILNDLNESFYRDNAASFDATRQSPWKGWLSCGDAIENLLAPGAESLRVCDLACGNLRFEHYLAERFAGCGFDVCALDSCDELAKGRAIPRTRIAYHSTDIVSALIGGPDELGRLIGAASFDVSACFGFMHHVPGHENRRRLLEALCKATRPDGLVLVSFWSFLENPGLAAKAKAASAEALATPLLRDLAGRLEEGDCFLGWKETKESYRYCHSFTEAEVDALAAGLAERARVLNRFRADGRDGRLNIYLILQVNS